MPPFLLCGDTSLHATHRLPDSNADLGCVSFGGDEDEVEDYRPDLDTDGFNTVRREELSALDRIDAQR